MFFQLFYWVCVYTLLSSGIHVKLLNEFRHSMLWWQCSCKVDSSKQSVAIYKTGRKGFRVGGGGKRKGLQAVSHCPASAHKAAAQGGWLQPRINSLMQNFFPLSRSNWNQIFVLRKDSSGRANLGVVFFAIFPITVSTNHQNMAARSRREKQHAVKLLKSFKAFHREHCLQMLECSLSDTNI